MLAIFPLAREEYAEDCKGRGVMTTTGTRQFKPVSQEVRIVADGRDLSGELDIPEAATGIVLFAHGSGSSRKSPRNQFVARTLREAKLGTLLFDLLTREEEALDWQTGHLRFDIDLLARRLIAATEWITREFGETVPVGYFGASTGGGAALVSAARVGPRIGAVVSRGGRPDMAGAALPHVQSPTLLIVGGDDAAVIELNGQAFEQLQCEKDFKIIPGASHLFEEPGALAEVARFAADWFGRHLRWQQSP